MEIFVRIVDQGSLSAAARSSGMSVTMVGKHLSFLEDRLGVRLLERTTRSQSITEVGRAFYERCKQLIADAQDAEASASEHRSVAKGLLRISSTVTFGTERLSDALALFLRRNPELRVELRLSDHKVNLVAEGFDVAFYVGDPLAPGLVERTIMPYRMVICASPDYLRGKTAIKQPGDLQQHTCLGFSFWNHRNRWRLVGATGQERFTVQGNLTTNSGQALRRAALAGLGVIMQPELLLEHDLRDARLTRLLPDAMPTPKRVRMIYAANRRQTRKLQAFTQFMEEHFQL